MDPAFIILCLSLILQTVAAIISLRVIIIRKRLLAGTVMLLVVLFLVLRVFLSLYRLFFEYADAALSLASEMSSCAVSLILVLGFLYFSRRAAPLRSL